LGEVFTFRQGIQRGVKLQTEENTESNVRFLRIVDYTQGTESPRYIEHPGEQYLVNANDICLVRYGASTGFVCKGYSGVLANNLFRVIPRETELIHSNYLYYFLRSSYFQGVIAQKMNGAAMPAISFGMIKGIPFPFATIDEQRLIATKVIKIEEESKAIVKCYLDKIRILDELNKSILQKAFSGEFI